MIRPYFLAAAVIVSLAVPGPALAQTEAATATLDDALLQTLLTNPAIAADAARVRAAEEALPQARSDALPSLSASGSANATRREGGGLPDTSGESWSAGLSAGQLLYAGGAVSASVRQARAGIVAAQADFIATRQRVLLDVATAYAGVRQARAALQARETTVSNLMEVVRFAEAQFEAGVTTRTDLAQAQARLAQARAQFAQAQAALAAQSEAYLRLTGVSPPALAPVSADPRTPSSLESALSRAQDRNPTLQASVASAVAAEAGVDVARSVLRPRVSLEAGVSNSGGFDDEETARNDSVGVRFSVPLFTGGLNASRIREQEARARAARLDVNAVERAVREQVATTWTSFVAAQAAYAASEEQLRAAELAYRGVRLEQETGLRTTVEVLDQEQDLLTARLALAQAERDLVVAERQLMVAVGIFNGPIPRD